MPSTRLTLFTLPLSAALGLFGCNADVKSCNQVAGYYEPLYTLVDGNCGAIVNPNMVNFDGGNHGVNTNIQKLPNAWVTTDIVVKGCSVHMTQKITAPMGTMQQQTLQSQIDGEKIKIDDEEELTGLVTISHFDETGTAPVCTGTYEATFSKRVDTTGGAVPGGSGAVPGAAGSGS